MTHCFSSPSLPSLMCAGFFFTLQCCYFYIISQNITATDLNMLYLLQAPILNCSAKRYKGSPGIKITKRCVHVAPFNKRAYCHDVSVEIIHLSSSNIQRRWLEVELFSCVMLSFVSIGLFWPRILNVGNVICLNCRAKKVQSGYECPPH